MPAVPFAEVVVAPMCFYSKGIDVAMTVHGDDVFAEGRADALLRADEYLRNTFQINLVSLTGAARIPQACDRLRHRRLGLDRRPSAQQEAFPRAQPWRTKGAATPGSKATVANDPHSEDNLTCQQAERYRSHAGRLLYHSLDVPRVHFDTCLASRGLSTPRVPDEAATSSGALHRGSTRVWTSTTQPTTRAVAA